MAQSITIAGLSLAAVALIGRYTLRKLPNITKSVNDAMKKIAALDGKITNSKYYIGGFDRNMNRREAALILGIRPSASKSKIKEAFHKIISHNHPDRGGSPYIASKINEARDFMEKNIK